MSNYFLDINGSVDLSDYSIIDDYIKVVDFDDNITIKFDSNFEQDIKIIETILQKDDFNILKKGGINNGKYFIEAYKKK